MMHRILPNSIFFCCLLTSLLFSTQLCAQASPWGTGTISNLSLDSMNGQALYVSHTSNVVNTSFDLNNYLDNYSFNVYIPNSYDGTKPYGLVSFINSGNTGSIISSWVPVLEEKNLILIAGNNIGNSVSVVTRIGVAFAGAEKLKEVLNIDPERVYASGNSGGARSCAALIFFFPEKFQGMLANCGSSYLRQVAQDYETFQPNSHYEYGIFQYNSVHLDYVKSFDRRYAMMTSYDDFREGDIMNIYHNGMEEDGFKSKMLETAGPHCSTSSEHFRDAVNFVEHPHIPLIVDSFQAQPLHGHGFKTAFAYQNSQEELEFYFDQNQVARAYAKDPFLWNDEKGAIFKTSIELDSSLTEKNCQFHIGILDFADWMLYSEDLGPDLYPAKPNFLLSLDFSDSLPALHILGESPFGALSNDTLFSGRIRDWPATKALDLKFHLWNQELRIELGHHLDSSFQVAAISKVLDDYRSIQIRTSNNYWDLADFNQGSLLSFTAIRTDSSLPASSIRLQQLELYVADTLDCTFADQLLVDTVNSCEASYTWIDGNSYNSNLSNVFYYITDSMGCDSLIELRLSIDSINPAVLQTANTLFAEDGDANYQWISCADGSPLPGAINQSFEATMNGDYAVVLTKNDCVDTSACFTVTGVSLSTPSTAAAPLIFPNPSSGQFLVDLKTAKAAEIEICDLQGRILQRASFSQQRFLPLQLNASPGLYFLKIISGETQYVLRLGLE